jgi:hypothetical protein
LRTPIRFSEDSESQDRLSFQQIPAMPSSPYRPQSTKRIISLPELWRRLETGTCGADALGATLAVLTEVDDHDVEMTLSAIRSF